MVISNRVDKQAKFQLKLNIIFENNDFLVINKPAGLIVHPIKSLAESSLISILLKKYPEIKNVGEDSLRPGIVHRLDKDVSGLMVVAKNQTCFNHLKNEFKNHRVLKEYLALVLGVVKKEKDIIVSSLVRDKKGKMILAKSADLNKIKESWTEYKVIRRFAPTQNYADDTQTNAEIQRKSASSQCKSVIFTLLKVKIMTGRTHQIRLHLKSIGHPIVGDKKHKIKRQKPIDLDRLFLHASKLGFFDQNNQWYKFQADLPKELKDFLQKID